MKYEYWITVTCGTIGTIACHKNPDWKIGDKVDNPFGGMCLVAGKVQLDIEPTPCEIDLHDWEWEDVLRMIAHEMERAIEEAGDV